ncbi:MAG: hypothetical protein M0R73_11630 [Dehalococcoidia bacterium]|nr:hypothetical protein [Dehalococcoidia bacterium]
MFKTLAVVTVSVAIGYVAARQLLSNETRLDGLPEGARGPLEAARRGLLEARERARVALHEARDERLAAEAELTARYREKAGRSTDITSST